MSENEKIFLHKLRQLLNTSTFNDIVFNCKDGKVSGNRLMLSLYSPLLRRLFEENPFIVCHPLNENNADSGINVSETSVKHVECLLQVINAQKSVEISDKPLVDGTIAAAKLMQIELKVDCCENSVKIKALLDAKDEKQIVKADPLSKATSKGETFDKITTVAESKEINLEKTAEATREVVGKRKIAENANSSSKRGRGRGRARGKSPSSIGSTVCPHCNITCKSYRGLQVHIGYIHKNESKPIQINNEKIAKTSEKEFHSTISLNNSNKFHLKSSTDKIKHINDDANISNASMDESKSTENSQSKFLGEDINTGIVPNDEKVAIFAENQEAKSLTSVAEEKSVDGKQTAGFKLETPNLNPSIDNPTPNLGKSMNLAMHTEEQIEEKAEPGIGVVEVPLLSNQPSGTLISLPKEQLYIPIGSGLACGICGLVFPKYDLLNFHMTHDHGLTILVAKN